MDAFRPRVFLYLSSPISFTAPLIIPSLYMASRGGTFGKTKKVLIWPLLAIGENGEKVKS
jgi:hypothetical protein